MLPEESARWNADEIDRAETVLDGRPVVVNVRRRGPHARLVPWLVDTGLLVYVGHAGTRHGWPESDFANPFYREVRHDRERMVQRYAAWLDEQPELLARLRAGELSGRALGCWCAPQRCHAGVLADRVTAIDTGRDQR